MAYESKVILVSMAGYLEAVKESVADEKELRLLKKIYTHVAKMANAEGVVVGPFDADDKEANP